ncbi:uncharacterized protein ALTATR162_LOCUS11822 [Alternaria atra]|uniref:Uncharacterized protein n=1 Tax=Alternaria atra TaxID=119953 RepID=A0A8J2IGB6_9PLEO|nr:uncharacterized protein ALTATR162_LOCUS11822 [Alternaria atra]CAG5187921.1 unnamed protein product [Alternaria atra]
MSDANSDDWVDSPSSVEQDEQQFPKSSVEEVERTAYRQHAPTHRRTSSLSSGIAAMSLVQLASAQPRQPTSPPPPHSSTLPNQIEHEPDHDRNRSPKSSLPDYHDPDSPTQKRGKGIVRNPVADTWREDAYMKEKASERKITVAEASKVQDRWRCEYCGRLNERGTETTASENPATTTPTILTRDGDIPQIGAPGPSDESTEPVYVPQPPKSGVPYAKCGYCREKLPLNPAKYDVRGLPEDGIR